MTCPRVLFPVFCGVCVALVLMLSGCSSTVRTVTGKVLPGKAGVVMLVAADDPRLESPGIGDVRLRLTHGRGTPDSLAETTTRPDGSFSLRIAEAFIRGRIEVIATGPTVLTCRGAVYLPTDDRRLLVIVEPKGAAGVNTHSVNTHSVNTHSVSTRGVSTRGVSTHGAGEQTR